MNFNYGYKIIKNVFSVIEKKIPTKAILAFVGNDKYRLLFFYLTTLKDNVTKYFCISSKVVSEIYQKSHSSDLRSGLDDRQSSALIKSEMFVSNQGWVDRVLQAPSPAERTNLRN